jgi:DNA-binding XRE family transcriptional regulator
MIALPEVRRVDKKKRKLLEAQGWKVAGTREFLDLTEEELEYIEIKIGLSQLVKEQRKRRRLTQKRAARLIGSSQSRVAKMEAGDPSISIDLYVKSIIALGASREELSQAIKADVLSAA